MLPLVLSMVQSAPTTTAHVMNPAAVRPALCVMSAGLSTHCTASPPTTATAFILGRTVFCAISCCLFQAGIAIAQEWDTNAKKTFARGGVRTREALRKGP